MLPATYTLRHIHSGSALQAPGIVILTSLAVRLLTGCTMVANAPTDAKAVVSAALKDAYAYGGTEAVSNRIEKLVTDGKITAAQATNLHALAQHLYDRVIERLDDEVTEALLETNAGGATNIAAEIDYPTENADAYCGACEDCEVQYDSVHAVKTEEEARAMDF